MKNISFYFQIHHPIRLKQYRFFDIGQDHYYYDDFLTDEKISLAVEQSYLPALHNINEMIKSSNGLFKCTFAISGVTMELLELYAQEVIDMLKTLAKTGSVEFAADTYSHSLASVYDKEEFVQQVKLQSKKIESLFGKSPTVFVNSELIYSDEIGDMVYELGFNTILIEEVKHVMGWKSPNQVYAHSYNPNLKVLIRNNKLSDDIAIRFSDRSWTEFPLTAEKYTQWIDEIPGDNQLVNIGMGLEAFGLYNHADSGVFEFLKAIPYHAMEKGCGFMLPSEVNKKLKAVDQVHSPYPLSWSANKDLSSWNGNDLQQEALGKLYAVGNRVRLSKDKPLQDDWLKLQTSENFRYMSHSDAYGSHYASPYEAFTNYMNILADFLDRVAALYPSNIEDEELNSLLQTIENQNKEIVKLNEEISKLKAKIKKGK